MENLLIIDQNKVSDRKNLFALDFSKRIHYLKGDFQGEYKEAYSNSLDVIHDLLDDSVANGFKLVERGCVASQSLLDDLGDKLFSLNSFDQEENNFIQTA